MNHGADDRPARRLWINTDYRTDNLKAFASLRPARLLLPNIGLLQPLVNLLEILFMISLILGIVVRLFENRTWPTADRFQARTLSGWVAS